MLTPPCFRHATPRLQRFCQRHVSNLSTLIRGFPGAGKSTLLNVLTRRLVADTAPAALVAEDATDVSWADAVAFVPQHDCLLATDTVWETLMFVANLRKVRQFVD